MGYMSVMRRLLVTTRFMMFRGFRMVFGRMRVVLRRFLMMLGWCMFHLILLPILNSIQRRHRSNRVLPSMNQSYYIFVKTVRIYQLGAEGTLKPFVLHG